ncbi:MAG: hypothetical protein ACJAR9_000956 [Celeribacter sp.]|jgi:hypothetical protein
MFQHMFRLQKTKAITQLTLEAPKPSVGREGLAIVLIVKDEEQHIEEWATFHLAAGVSHFYVYDNGCTDQTLPRLLGVVGQKATVVPWDQKLLDARSGAQIHNQVLAYAHAIRNFGAQHRWMSFIDADEFLVPKAHADLPSCLAHLPDEACISLPWHMFGRNGFEAPPHGGVVANYTQRFPEPLDPKGVCNFKLILDPCRVTSMGVHVAQCDQGDHTVNDRGVGATQATRRDASFYSADFIQLNHYYTRSNSELEAKINRGSNMRHNQDKHRRKVLDNVARVEADTIEDRVAQHWFSAQK